MSDATNWDHIYVGAIGLEFKFTVKESGTAKDINDANLITYVFVDEAGNGKTVEGAFDDDGSDGIVTWTTDSADDLDSAGLWTVQVVVGYANGNDLPTGPKKFSVKAREPTS